MNTLLQNTAAPALDRFLDRLRCPATGAPLRRDGAALANIDGTCRYSIAPGGIPLFAEAPARPESLAQQRHYDRIATDYLGNLALAQTEEYTAYLDRLLMDAIGDGALGHVGEICCGRGEAIRLLEHRASGGVASALGFDISAQMLAAARRENPDPSVLFVQADATALPVADETFDTVFVFGGIHHVNDRDALFGEVRRVLAPGGRLVFREPLNDFLLWRMLRAAIYKLSPTLDEATERPLRERETRAALEAAGLRIATWRPCGLIGFCLFMNSDVLVFNRLLRFIPGIRAVTRAFARLDSLLLRLPLIGRAGLQVVGVAERP